MAPEQVRGHGVGPAADVYALGAVLFELVAGRPPFRGADVAELLRRIAAEPAPALAEVVPDCPAELAAIVDRALAADPEQRFASCAELASALGRMHERERRAERRLLIATAAAVAPHRNCRLAAPENAAPPIGLNLQKRFRVAASDGAGFAGEGRVSNCHGIASALGLSACAIQRIPIRAHEVRLHALQPRIPRLQALRAFAALARLQMVPHRLRHLGPDTGIVQHRDGVLKRARIGNRGPAGDGGEVIAHHV